MADDETSTELSHMGKVAAAVMFMIADAAGLPDPHHLSIFGILNGHPHNSASLQFPPHEASTEVIALWALRFGGVIQSHTKDTDNGPELWVRAEFTWQEFLHVTVYAHIPLPRQEAITSAKDDSEPETVPV